MDVEAMAEQTVQANRREKVSVFLKKHEQWSAWAFYTLMSFLLLRFGVGPVSQNMDFRCEYDLNIYYLIGNAWMQGVVPYSELSDLKGPLTFLQHGLGSLLTPGSLCGIALLHAPILGIMLLYTLKLCSLYIRRSSAWAITGVFFIFNLSYGANPAELTTTLQMVVLYHLLVWARGKRNFFCDRHFFLIGLSIAVALLTKYNQLVFFVPASLLMLWVHRHRVARALGLMLLGFVPLTAGFILCLHLQGALGAMWEEYIMTAIRYGTPAWADCALMTRHIELFGIIFPETLFKTIPNRWLILPGMLLFSLWVIPARRCQPARRTSTLLTLLAALLLQVYATFRGTYAFQHYYFCFYPYAALSILGMALLLHRFIRVPRVLSLLRGAGLACPLGTLCLALSIPVLVLNFKPHKGVGELRAHVAAVADHLRQHPKDYLITEPMLFVSIYRHTQTTPPILHFTPQLTPEGKSIHEQELCSYIRQHRPRYLVGHSQALQDTETLCHAAGVTYRPIPTPGNPPSPPPTAYLPMPQLFERVD